MSEYQHYEFHVVGRRLSGKARTQVGALSSHITINSSSAWVDYHWGDFKHDPMKVLEKYFDVFVYDCNWGTQQIAFRWDAGSVDFKELKRFAVDEMITVSKKKDSIFLHAAFNENIQDYLFDGEDEDGGIRFAAFTDFIGEVQTQDSVCGDATTSDYHILNSKIPDEAVATIRLCDDCVKIRESIHGEKFVDMPTGRSGEMQN
ncbi:MAG: hypothetical protein PHD76_01420 [Methylacidiphilales bacterium]|nr:hypothetical protein [Candidatus Methylacidiphilales bacterium]